MKFIRFCGCLLAVCVITERAECTVHLFLRPTDSRHNTYSAIHSSLPTSYDSELGYPAHQRDTSSQRGEAPVSSANAVNKTCVDRVFEGLGFKYTSEDWPPVLSEEQTRDQNNERQLTWEKAYWDKKSLTHQRLLIAEGAIGYVSSVVGMIALPLMYTAAKADPQHTFGYAALSVTPYLIPFSLRLGSMWASKQDGTSKVPWYWNKAEVTARCVQLVVGLALIDCLFRQAEYSVRKGDSQSLDALANVMNFWFYFFVPYVVRASNVCVHSPYDCMNRC
ncbi:MAG: hypothetical protein V4482_04665 [Pseudomonadota bacterium]